MRAIILHVPGIVAAFCLAAFVLMTVQCSNKGIVALKGFQHGVAFCGNEFSYVVHGKEDHAWYDKENNITYVINAGHLDDPEVKELEKLAETHCEELFSKK